MSVPEWWEALLLAAAAWRSWHLVAHDTITEKLREPVKGKPRDWLECPYCAGFWSVLAWWGAWQLEEKWTLVAATPFALSAAVVLVALTLDALSGE